MWAGIAGVGGSFLGGDLAHTTNVAQHAMLLQYRT
jgi:hypothetical protein